MCCCASEIEYVWFCVNIYRARRKEKKRKQERKQINIIRYERAALFLLLSSSTRKELKRGNLNVARVTKETGSNLGISPTASRLGRVREEVCRRVQLYPARVVKYHFSKGRNFCWNSCESKSKAQLFSLISW